MLVLGCDPGSSTSTQGDDGDATSTSSNSDNSDTSDTSDEECLELIVYEGDLDIDDASQIPNYDCVVEITGDLNFDFIDTPLLDGFPRLERVGGNLRAWYTRNIEEIAGFPELREVRGMHIGDGWSESPLEHISGFAKLEHVEWDLNLHIHGATDISGLGAVKTVGHDLLLSVNSLEGLNVEWVGRTLSIGGSSGLVDLTELDSLAALPPIVEIGYNIGLVSLAGLEKFTTAQYLTIHDNPSLTNIDALANMTEISGGLDITHNFELADLAGLAALSKVGGLSIQGNPKLANLAGLAALTEVDGSINIVNNDALLDLHGSWFPTTITGSINICENDSLALLPTNLAPMGSSVYVTRNKSLPNAIAREFATALGHRHAKIAANEDFGVYPKSPCPFVDDGACDQYQYYDVFGGLMMCDALTGENCCDSYGPTGLCASDPDCP